MKGQPMLHLNLDYATLLTLVDQLALAEKYALISYLGAATPDKALSSAEKIALLDAAKVDHVILVEPSLRRDDWYNDDGR